MMEALTNLKDHCPDWARRLDELSGQIEKRQLELAEFAARQQQQQQQQSVEPSNGWAASRKSMRRRGSTESLRPKDEGEVPSGGPDTQARTSLENNKNVAQDVRRASVGSRGGVEKPKKDLGNGNGNINGGSNGGSNHGNGASLSSPSSSERRTNQVMAVASAKARAALRRTQLSRRRAAAAATESLLSADGARPSKHRSRNLVAVYYDGYVQSFFEDLVKFVSVSRNLMRKAKMAARVAQIKRMAELEMPDDDDDDDSSSETLGDGVRWDGNGTVRLVPPRPAPRALRSDPSNLHAPGDTTTTTITNGEDKENAAEEEKRRKKEEEEEEGPKGPASDGKSSQPNGNGGLPAAPTPPAGQPPHVRPAVSLNGSANNGRRPSPPSTSRPGHPRVPLSTRPSMAGGGFSFSGFGYGLGGGGGGGGGPGEPQRPDVLDELDKGLEYVQSMCEHAAHQFLRDGDCADEIVKIRDRLNETKEAADREIGRMQEQEQGQGQGQEQSEGGNDNTPRVKMPEGEEPQPARNRIHRPHSVRRDGLGVGPSSAAKARTSFGSGGYSMPKLEGGSEKPAVEKEVGGPLGEPNGFLEVDESAVGNGETNKPSRLQYRSTRAMGPRRMAQ